MKKSLEKKVLKMGLAGGKLLFCKLACNEKVGHIKAEAADGIFYCFIF